MEKREFIKALITSTPIKRTEKLDLVQSLVIDTLCEKGLINRGKNNYVIHMGGDKLPIQGVLYGLIDSIYCWCDKWTECKKKLIKINRIMNEKQE